MKAGGGKFLVAALAARDAGEWRALYRGYAEFYRQPMNDEILARVWAWVGQGRLVGVMARADGVPAGFAHVEYVLRPLRGQPLAYLHDLFVAKSMRGRGCGRALLAHVRAAAAVRGCGHARWMTKTDNAAARRLYDSCAEVAGEWVVYQQDLAAKS